jgi:hypothetical protein
MFKILRELWLINVERAKARRAVRNLISQEWSLEFLVHLLNRTTVNTQKNCHVVLRNKHGQEVVIYAGMPEAKNVYKGVQDELDIRQETVSWEAVRDAAEVHGLL